MRCKLVLLFFSIFCIAKSKAQLEIKFNNNEVSYATCKIEFSLQNTTILNNSSLLNIKKEDWKPLTKNKPKISYSPQTTWLKINLDDIKNYGAFDYVNINNPHINFLKCWILKKDTIIKSFDVTGDNLPFANKPMATSNFVFNLNSNTYNNCYLIIAADKRYTKLDLPVIFCTQNYFASKSAQSNILYGIAIGFCMLLLLFNFYLLITIRKNFYAWYSIYLALICFYFYINSGLFYQYNIPNNPVWNDILRPLIFCFIELPLALFFIDLLNIKFKFKKLYFLNKAIVSFYALVYVIALISLLANSFELHGFLLKFSGYILFPYLFFYLFQSLFFIKQKVVFAKFYFLSFIFFLVFTSIYSLAQKEIIVSNSFTNYSNYWAIISETIIATALLVWQYKFYRDEALQLQQKNNKLQHEVYKETVAWQEKELLRLSSILHDTVGANLGFLRLETDNMPLTIDGRNYIADYITRIGNEVRSMSHTFSPFVLKNKGLFESINEVIKNINNNTSINLQFEWLGEKEIILLSYQGIVYQIVQELLQNMLKHSQATTAFLQIITEENIVNIYVEDDGIGFIQNKTTQGIGLKNIENLMKLLHGNFIIKTNHGEGTNISIEFKMKSYENI
jgi:signal transduction histidine kinase